MALTVLFRQVQKHNGAMAAPTGLQQQQQQQNISYHSTFNTFALAPAAGVERTKATEAFLRDLHTSAGQRANFKTRLRKRESIREMNSEDMTWSNPCRGVIDKFPFPPKSRRHGAHCPPYCKVIRTLRRIIREKLNQVRPAQANKATTRKPNAAQRKSRAIDINDMTTWRLHNYTYQFLPTLGTHSIVKLRQWHRNLQLYVGAFTYMRRAQSHYDYHHEKYDSPVSQELQDLKLNAILALCGVESAINQTECIYSRKGFKRRPDSLRARNTTSIRTISRSLMESKLKNFQTPVVQVNFDAPANMTDEWNLQVDVRFLKHYYVTYLRHMAKLLGQQAKRVCSANTTALTRTPTATRVHGAYKPKPVTTQPKKKLRKNSSSSSNNNNNNDYVRRLHKQETRTEA